MTSSSAAPDRFNIPPHSIEAEQAVLGAVLRDGEILGAVLDCFASIQEVFYDPAHQKIFDCFVDLQRETKPVDLITVMDRLAAENILEDVGGRGYLIDLAESGALAHNLSSYAGIVRERFILRQLAAIGRLITSIAHESTDARGAIDRAQQRLFEVAEDRRSNAFVHIEQIAMPVWADIEERARNPGHLLGVASGFKDLDTLTAGLQKSELIIVAARPSMGKTAFCLNIAEFVGIRERLPVLVFSLEMSKEQLVQRMIASISGIDSQKLRTGNGMGDPEWKKISEAIGHLTDAPIFIDDSAMLSVMDVRFKARRLLMEAKALGLIVIDYIQLMQGSRATENRVQEISEISRGLKTLARELKVPIIALSQLSRGVETRQNKRPMLSDLRESGAIEQDADLVMFLYRHEYYEPEETEHRGECEVIIAKQRNGPVGTIKLQFNGATTRFRNLESRTPLRLVSS